MLRSLWISAVYGMFLCAGIMAPFALGLGYIWVDNFSPQNVVYSILTEFPVSLVMGVAAVLSYLLADRRHPPHVSAIMVLMVMMLIWCTFTTFNDPVAPAEAEFKWNWASKDILFALFMPALFRSRIQIEAFLQIYVLSLSAQFLPFAGKTIISGGSYGTNLGLLSGNYGLSEGSTLSTVCMVAAVLCLYLAKHQIILPNWRIIRLGYLGMFIACIATGVGTYERDALVGIAVVLGAQWLRSPHKILWALAVGGAAAALSGYVIEANSSWLQRMMTIGDTHESSSLGRLLVWQWTLNFAQTHPLGGGFYSYVTDTIVYPATPEFPDIVTIHGKAFHSIYFELLGEQGWPGLALFGGLVTATLITLRRVRNLCRSMEGMAWAGDLAGTMIVAMVVLLVCGAFISIAFQPEMYYTFAVAVMLREHVGGVRRRIVEEDLKRAEREERRRGEFGEDLGHNEWAGVLA